MSCRNSYAVTIVTSPTSIDTAYFSSTPTPTCMHECCGRTYVRCETQQVDVCCWVCPVAVSDRLSSQERFPLYLHCKVSLTPRECLKQFDREIRCVPSRTAVLGRCQIRRDAAAICDDCNIRNDRHSQRLLDDWIWKRVEPCVDARIAWRAWSGQTSRGSELWIPSGRIVRYRGSAKQTLII